jgi:hypothetical protein
LLFPVARDSKFFSRLMLSSIHKSIVVVDISKYTLFQA